MHNLRTIKIRLAFYNSMGVVDRNENLEKQVSAVTIWEKLPVCPIPYGAITFV